MAVTDAELKEIKTDGKQPPSGWRQDLFEKDGVVRRSVWAPPWSMRPPHLEPETWVSLSKKNKEKKRQEWKVKDPDGVRAARMPESGALEDEGRRRIG